MGFLKNIIKKGVSDGISQGIRQAVGGAVEKAVNPVAEKWANQTAQSLDSAAGTTQADAQATNNAFANLQRAAENYANVMEQAAKDAGYTPDTANGEVPYGESPFDEFYVYVPEVFPEWICGGSDHELRCTGNYDSKGKEIVTLRCSGSPIVLGRYLALLEQNGFVQNYDAWKKTVNGTTYCLDTTDACVDGAITISFYTE